MIKRKKMSELIAWKNSAERMPLLLFGARQVGKTYLLNQFGKEQYKQVYYFNFDEDPKLASIFEPDLNVERIITSLNLIRPDLDGIEPETTLIIFDEIQVCPRALTSLKYFKEQAPQFHIAAAGSLPGLTRQEGTGFPVGCVDIMHLYPCSFSEFLETVNPTLFKTYAELDTIDKTSLSAITDYIHEPLNEMLNHYYIVGGMPNAVMSFATNKNFEQVRNIQNRILESYQADFSKHVPNNEIKNVNQIWQTIPRFLSRENKKFIFGQVRQGARAKDLEGALDWLEHAGLIYRVSRVEAPKLPLEAYAQFNSFKAFVVDVGLLGAMSRLDPLTILNHDDAYIEFKGSFAEQYVCQELISNFTSTPKYWSALNSNGEIDFLTDISSKIYAIEVKSSDNLRAKSLKIFKEKHPQVIAIRTSLSAYREESWLSNIPLWAIGTSIWNR